MADGNRGGSGVRRDVLFCLFDGLGEFIETTGLLGGGLARLLPCTPWATLFPYEGV